MHSIKYKESIGTGYEELRQRLVEKIQKLTGRETVVIEEALSTINPNLWVEDNYTDMGIANESLPGFFLRLSDLGDLEAEPVI